MLTCKVLFAMYLIRMRVSTNLLNITSNKKTLQLKASKNKFTRQFQKAKRDFGEVVKLAANKLLDLFRLNSLLVYAARKKDKLTLETKQQFNKGYKQLKGGIQQLQKA